VQANPLAVEAELGDVLLTLTSVARHLRVSAELALGGAAVRFVRRVQHMEAGARASGRSLGDLDAKELDVLWQEAKHATAAV